MLEDDADEPNDGHVIYARDGSESVGMFEGSNMEMGSPQPASFYPEDQGEPLPVPPKRVQPVRTEI